MTARVPMSVLLDAVGNAAGAVTIEDGRWIGRDTYGRLLFEAESQTQAAHLARAFGEPVSTVEFGLLPTQSGEQRSERVAIDRHGFPMSRSRGRCT